MIYSSLSAQKAQCNWPALFEKAFDFLRRPDLADLDIGRYEIEGDDVFALVQLATTAPVAEKKPESHFNYIDIQFLVTGAEKQGYAPLTPGVTGEERPDNDVIFYDKVEHENFVTLQPGDFAVYFTNDIHRPNCAVSESREIKKVVVKVREAALA